MSEFLGKPGPNYRTGINWQRVELSYLELASHTTTHTLDLLSRLITLARENTWIAGGFVRALLENSDNYTDIDIYCDNLMTRDHHINILSRAAAPGENNTLVIAEGQVLQLTKLFFKSIEEVLDSFDFTVCQFGIDLHTWELVYNPAGLIDLVRHRLIEHRVSRDPEKHKLRIEKYNKKGFYLEGQTPTTYTTSRHNSSTLVRLSSI